MSLHKINVRLKEMGLTKAQRDEIIDMIRQFGLGVLERHTRFLQ
jgi:hypothetical protein